MPVFFNPVIKEMRDAEIAKQKGQIPERSRQGPQVAEAEKALKPARRVFGKDSPPDSSSRSRRLHDERY